MSKKSISNASESTLHKRKAPNFNIANMQILATHINYLQVCHRKLWLFVNGINMEHTSDIVYDGKLLHETAYPQRAEKHSEIELSATLADGVTVTGKIDFYDSKNRIIHETKRSSKMETAHEWQSKFYIWLLELNGIPDAHAILEYPTVRERKEVLLNDDDRLGLQRMVADISNLQRSKLCPPRINARICKSCSYYDLCYIDEA